MTAIQIPKMIYGTAWKKERTADLVVQAIQAGFTGIDTACQPKHYSEELVGEALNRLQEQGIERETLFVQTKFTSLDGQDPQQVPYDKDAPIKLQVQQSFERSQENLQTKYLDSLILHSPMSSHAMTMKVWDAMQSIHQSNGTRQLGISNCYNIEVLKQIYRDATIKPTIVQNRFYQDTGYDKDVRKWCAEQGIIYQSFWTLTANPHILSSDTLSSIAHKYSKTTAQIFFRYLTQSGIIPLTGTCDLQHMQQDLSIFNFELAGEDVQSIDCILDASI